MPKRKGKKTIIVIFAFILIGVLAFFITKQAISQSIVPGGTTQVVIPQGVGLRDLQDAADSRLDDLGTGTTFSNFPTQPLNPQIDFQSFLRRGVDNELQCSSGSTGDPCSTPFFGGLAQAFIPNIVAQPLGFGGEQTVIQNIWNVDIDTTFFFESDPVHELTLSLSLTQPSLLSCTQDSDCDVNFDNPSGTSSLVTTGQCIQNTCRLPGEVFAWVESELPEGSSARTTAELLFGKPVSFNDVSKDILIGDLDYNFILSPTGVLPAGRYDFYAVFTRVETIEVIETGGNLVGNDHRWYPITDVFHIPFSVLSSKLYYVAPLDTSCIGGYKPQVTGQFTNSLCDGSTLPLGTTGCVCIRADISQLNCIAVQSCPVSIDFAFECASNGDCVQIVSSAQQCLSNNDCDTNERCQVSSGLCVNEALFEDLFGCTEATVSEDCHDPLCKDSMGADVTFTCVDNKCEYSGQCSPQFADCLNRECPVNYECIEEGENIGQCAVSNIIIPPPTNGISPPGSQDPLAPSFFEENKALVIGIGVAVVVIFLIVIIISIRKGKGRK